MIKFTQTSLHFVAFPRGWSFWYFTRPIPRSPPGSLLDIRTKRVDSPPRQIPSSCRIHVFREHPSRQVACGTCRKNFCFRHRHEEDHKCEGTAEASRREHPHLQKRGIGRAGGPGAGPIAVKAGADGDSRRCGTQAGEAAARRERESKAVGGAGTGVAAR